MISNSNIPGHIFVINLQNIKGAFFWSLTLYDWLLAWYRIARTPCLRIQIQNITVDHLARGSMMKGANSVMPCDLHEHWHCERSYNIAMKDCIYNWKGRSSLFLNLTAEPIWPSYWHDNKKWAWYVRLSSGKSCLFSMSHWGPGIPLQREWVVVQEKSATFLAVSISYGGMASG